MMIDTSLPISYRYLQDKLTLTDTGFLKSSLKDTPMMIEACLLISYRYLKDKLTMTDTGLITSSMQDKLMIDTGLLISYVKDTLMLIKHRFNNKLHEGPTNADLTQVL
jgi:hypothetical protein